MSDRKLGYILMLLTLFLLLGVASYFAWLTYYPLETRTLRFPEVGSLAVEDPVRMNGTLVGVISGFEHDSLGRVLVSVQTPRNFSVFKKSEYPKSIPIRTSSSVTVKVKGLMGERYIEIGLGDPGDPLVPVDQIIDGTFEIGPSEAIAYMDLLAGKIIELRDIILWLRDGRDGKRSFITAFQNITGTVDTLVFTLLDGLSGMEEDINRGIDTAASIATQAAKLAADVSVKAPKIIEKTPEIIDGINNVIVKVDNVVTKMDSVFRKFDELVDKVEGNNLLWGEHAEKFQKQVAEIKRLIDSMRHDGLPIRVKLKFF